MLNTKIFNSDNLKYCFFLFLYSTNNIALGQSNYSVFNIDDNSRSQLIITVASQTHIDYGLSYPITYELTIPNEFNNLQSYYKFRSLDQWLPMVEKTGDDFFNGIDVVRFDYEENIAFVSISFSDISDTIFIKITDPYDDDIETNFLGISQYYDNRDAVVTSTADDWAGWSNEKFIQSCQIFRSYNLWLSCAVVTDVGDPNTWDDIQEQLDSGYVEVISHSRTHPYVPYDDPEGEVLGSKLDLIENLDLPHHNTYGDYEYIYVWVAPYGEYNESIDSLVSIGKYLVSRMYYDGIYTLASWDPLLYKFNPVGVSREVGPLWVGTTDTIDLNNTFDSVMMNGGVYHVMCHPNIIEWDEDYPWTHLDHISNRKNIWYTGFGHLYLYYFIYSVNQNLTNKVEQEKDNILINNVQLDNYPNPFNPITTINYQLMNDSFVDIAIYDVRGKLIKNLLSKRQKSGSHLIQWNAENNSGRQVSSGVYIYTINYDAISIAKKMMFIK